MSLYFVLEPLSYLSCICVSRKKITQTHMLLTLVKRQVNR